MDSISGDATSDGGSNVTPLPAQGGTESSPAQPNASSSSSSLTPPPPPSSSTLDKSDKMLRSTESLSSKKSFPQRSRSECNREREERVKRIREQQENDRRRKLEELKQHALSAQKFRQQQELERRRHIEELRVRDSGKRQQVEERKRALEEAERDRRIALLRKNKEREERIEQKRRAQNQMNYAFGSSTPRMIEPRVDSMSDLWGGTRSRSTSSSNVFAQMSQSMYCNRRSVERDSSTDARKQRATSAHGLDRNDGEDLMSQSFSGALATPTAHRRRTDLVPTLTASSRSTTPRSCKSPGLSRENTLHPSRPPSVMSTDSRSSVVSAGGVRMRSTPSRRPRPISIATTGVMSSSMYEKKTTPSPLAARNRQKSTSSLTGGDLHKKRARSVTSDREEDNKSTTSNSSSVMSKSMITRRTPAQVKADSAARKAKASTSSTPTHTAIHKKTAGSKSPSLSGSVKSLDGSGVPDELKSPKNEVSDEDSSKEPSPSSQGKDGEDSNAPVSSTGKRIITSEEEAKARLAEKRREMKEKKEREAELERQRLAELERLENERLQKEEEEERLAMAEAERLAEEARKAEEERLQKAIQEADRKREEERKKLEEEEKIRKEKEELEKKKQEELSEKLRKEEEERMLRKKRIEEIMSRTRKNNNNNNNNNTNVNNHVKSSDSNTSKSSSSPSEDSSKNGSEEDPIKDISDSVAQNHSSGVVGGSEDNVNNNLHENMVNNDRNDNFVKEENAKNSSKTAEKGGVIHSFISENNEADMDKNGDISTHGGMGDEDNPTRQDLDQIMELSVDPSNDDDDITQFSPPTTTPIIAFEESINVPKQEPPTADLLS